MVKDDGSKAAMSFLQVYNSWKPSLLIVVLVTHNGGCWSWESHMSAIRHAANILLFDHHGCRCVYIIKDMVPRAGGQAQPK